MERTGLGSLAAAIVTAVGALAVAAPASADDSGNSNAYMKPKMQAATILQLDAVREATAKYLDETVAVADGYVDIHVFIPHMGWHYLKESLVDDQFEATKPELLVYQDDPCGGPRKLVAVEYGVPTALVNKAPQGFAGKSDTWNVVALTNMWMVHAWVWEWNPAGVFNPTNSRVD
jgi:hypothetical protein